MKRMLDVARTTFDDLLNERASNARRTFEIPVLVAALTVVPVIYIEETASEPWLLTVAGVANWAIWAAFLIEYVTVVTLADQKWAYTRKAWLDVAIIVISFPLLPQVLGATRLLRLTRLTRVLRILRLVRLAAILTRGGRAAGVLFRKRGLGCVTLLTIMVALGVGAAFSVVEGLGMLEGLWWAMVTLTTVGYGDVFPVTIEGRLAATVLMLLGIGFVAFITASIAAHFVEEDDGGLGQELERLHERLDRIEADLEKNSVPPPTTRAPE